MIQCRHLFLTVACLLAFAGSAFAQLTQAKDNRIVFGHLHLHPSNVDAHKKFWIDTIGGQATKIGPIEAAKFPDLIVEIGSPSFGTTMPSGGTKGTTVPHVAFGVSDLRAMVAKVKAAGYPIVTREELPPDYADGEKDGIALRGDHNARVSIVRGPDDILVELVDMRSQTVPITMHHIQFDGPDGAAMTAWYEKLVGARRGPTGSSEALIPGATLMFSTASAPPAGTKGRALDHIGFEIRDLEAFGKQLQEMGLKLDRPYGKNELAGFGPFALIYLTDPWGTYIELTEGLNRVQ